MYIPEDILNIINKLEKNQYEAYIVGGSVRDSLIGRKPSDYDIATSAEPDEIIEVFKDYTTIEAGKKFGTIILRYNKKNIEITSYRIEGDYKDGRRPSNIDFTKNIRDDLSRRDFTINAMAYNPKTGILDFFNGREDIKNKIIRTVDNPNKRFKEDHLRILRAVRFASELDFNIEEDTYNSCKEFAELLKYISWERIRDEFIKIILCDKASKGIRIIQDMGILEIILPELNQCVGFDQKNPYHDMDVFNHSLCVLDRLPKNKELRLAGLFHDIGKPKTFSLDDKGIGHFYNHEEIGSEMSVSILRRFRINNKSIEKTRLLIKEHMGHFGRLSDKAIRRLIYRVKEENILDLIELQKADMSCTYKDRDISMMEEREKDIKRILNEKNVYEKNKLDIDGYDIMELGYKQGKQIGEIMDYLMEKVLDDPKINNMERLKKIIIKNFKN